MRNKRRAAVLTAAIVVLALAGCGGGDGGGGPLDTYKSQVNDALVPFGQALRGVGVASTAGTSPSQVESLLADAATAAKQSSQAVAAIDPPAAVRAPNQALASVIDSFSQTLDRATAGSASASTVKKLVAQAKAAATKLVDVKKQLAAAGVDLDG
jgi:hypothetical protein